VVKVLLSLILIGGVCGVLLVGTHHLTATEIQLNREAKARALMTAMLGAPLPDESDIQAATFGNCSRWVFQQITVPGYAGDIALRILWRPEREFTMRVTDHRETPGIGDFIDHQRDPWMTMLDGASAEDIVSVDNVTGATITTNAIRQAAQRSVAGIEAYCRG
jgi:electron transport complex protein RnfG